jgi:conjugative transposon TraM protein
MKTQSEQFLRKRKFLLVLPILALPFITLAFWSLGGGKGEKNTVVQQEKGLNTELPGAQNQATSLDKMSLYNQAAKDSLALAEQLRNDPYAVRDSSLATMPSAGDYGYAPSGNAGYQAYGDPNELKVKNRLAALEQALNSPQEASGNGDPYGYNRPDASMGNDIDRLEAMMRSMSEGNGNDPEMRQLNGMLENILDIQNPGRAQEKLREQSQNNKGRVYAVNRPQEQTTANVLSGATGYPLNAEGNAFYDISESQAATDTLLQIAIPAVVNETQTLVSGATLKMRLTEPVYINGVLIPAGTFVSGNCSVDGERLRIEVSGIRSGKNLFPVAMSAYDLDAIEGIRIPGAISRDAAKEGADRALQSVQLMGMDPSIGAQAAGAGIEAAKGLFGKKAKLVRVTVKAGHPVLLMDTKAKQAFN